MLRLCGLDSCRLPFFFSEAFQGIVKEALFPAIMDAFKGGGTGGMLVKWKKGDIGDAAEKIFSAKSA
jgi:hypothetical protein